MRKNNYSEIVDYDCKIKTESTLEFIYLRIITPILLVAGGFMWIEILFG